MMNRLLLSLLLFASVAVQAQTRIRGTVTDDNQEAIPGANVFLADTYDGTTTDAAGAFDFTTTETGTRVLTVKFVGYKDFTQAVELGKGDVTVMVVLKEAINELDAVTITAGAFAASDEKRRTIFRPLDIATTAGATADIAGALNTLPGTQKVGESGRLFVRGGDGTETRTFIDGIAVMEAYSPSAPNTPARGRFLPFMFKGTSFSTGGYSAEYGQALSSALVLDSKDEDKVTRTDFGILSVGGDVSHTRSWNGGSAAGKIGYTNVKPYMNVIDQRIDWKAAPVSLEGSGALRQRVGKQGIVKLYGNFSQSDFSLYNHDIDDKAVKTLFDLSNRYQYINGLYKTALSEKWSVRSGLSYNYLLNDLRIGEVDLKETLKGTHVKVAFDGSVADGFEIRSGAEVLNQDYRSTADTSAQALTFNETITALFAEADVYASNSLVMRAGGRLEYNNLREVTAVDPRVSMAYKMGNMGQVSLAYGRFRQSARKEWLRLDQSLKAELAEHYIFNYQLIENNRTFRAEAFYKKYDDLVKFSDEEFNNTGHGYARGFEFFWRDNRTVRNVDYWISYSYLDTERDYANTPYAVMPSYASRHNFSVVYKHFVRPLKTQFGVTYSYTSGRPYNDPNATRFNSGRTPNYQDLSVNISHLPSSQVIVYVSCTNVLGRDNIFGYEFGDTLNDDGRYTSRAVRQAAPRFLFIGVFITLSKEKTLNQLPSL